MVSIASACLWFNGLLQILHEFGSVSVSFLPAWMHAVMHACVFAQQCSQHCHAILQWLTSAMVGVMVHVRVCHQVAIISGLCSAALLH